MDEETETKAIEKWLRMVDKPLETKEGDKKGRGAKRRIKPCQRAEAFMRRTANGIVGKK